MVVFGNPVGPGGRSGLDLPGIQGNGKVSDGAVFRLPGTMAHDRGITVPMGQVYRFDGLGEGSDLVDLYQNGIGDTLADPIAQALHVGDEEIIADELHLLASQFGELLPSGPVVFRKSVLDRYDWVFGDPALPELRHLIGGEFIARRFFEDVLSGGCVKELGRSGIHGNENVLTRHITGLSDRIHDRLNRFFIRFQVRRESALVAYVGGKTFLLQDRFQVMEHFGSHPEGFGKRCSSDGHDHEFLEVDPVVGMGTAVQDVHHGQGKNVGVHATDVAIQGLSAFNCRCLGTGQ